MFIYLCGLVLLGLIVWIYQRDKNSGFIIGAWCIGNTCGRDTVDGIGSTAGACRPCRFLGEQAGRLAALVVGLGLGLSSRLASSFGLARLLLSGLSAGAVGRYRLRLSIVWAWYVYCLG